MLAAIRLALVVHVNALYMLLTLPIALAGDNLSERRLDNVAHQKFFCADIEPMAARERVAIAADSDDELGPETNRIIFPTVVHQFS